MKTKHDFKGALEWMIEDMKDDRTLDQMLQPYTEDIIFALKLAHAVQSDPTTSMVKAAIEESNKFGDNEAEAQNILYGAGITFEAMTAQMMKEIEND